MSEQPVPQPVQRRLQRGKIATGLEGVGMSGWFNALRTLPWWAKTVAYGGAIISFVLWVADFIDRLRKIYEAPETLRTLLWALRSALADTSPVAWVVLAISLCCLFVATSPLWIVIFSSDDRGEIRSKTPDTAVINLGTNALPKAKQESIRRQQTSQSAIDALAEAIDLGQALRSEPVNTDALYANWRSRLRRWQTETSDILAKQISNLSALNFKSRPPFRIPDPFGGYNGAHNCDLQDLREQLEKLERERAGLLDSIRS